MGRRLLPSVSETICKDDEQDFHTDGYHCDPRHASLQSRNARRLSAHHASSSKLVTNEGACPNAMIPTYLVMSLRVRRRHCRWPVSASIAMARARLLSASTRNFGDLRAMTACRVWEQQQKSSVARIMALGTAILILSFL